MKRRTLLAKFGYTSERKVEFFGNLAIYTSVGRFLECWTDSCWLSISIYNARTCWFSKTQFGYIIAVLKNNENIKEPVEESLVLCRLFHETCCYFRVFEITRTCDGSLIMNLFQSFFKELELTIS
jgi:hypothetical protein